PAPWVSRSPPSSSQPPAFFSKLTDNTSVIVKSKKQEMIKKMTVVCSEGDFSKSGLRTRTGGECRSRPLTEALCCCHLQTQASPERDLQHAGIHNRSRSSGAPPAPAGSPHRRLTPPSSRRPVSVRCHPAPEAPSNSIGLEAIIRKALMGNYDEQSEARAEEFFSQG
uniref:Uncharacterized protein n=1 Tax=Tetraodon nigroviridis TaxID=99883 RepID=H3DQN4_TETNG